MAFGSAFLLSLVLPLAVSAKWGLNQHNGVVRLWGSSFADLGPHGRNATYDYVIVGGGTAGLTLAKRLAEDSRVSVAIIEAGTFYEFVNSNFSQIPSQDAVHETTNPDDIQPFIDWGFITVPEPQLGNRNIAYTQGKTLGGSSARNSLGYHRATKGAFQKWADQVGDQSWSWDTVFEFYKRSANFTPPNFAKRGPGSEISFDPNAFNKTGGPLHVSYTNYFAPASPFIRAAFEKLGLPEIDGLDSGRLLGFSEIKETLDPEFQTRSSSETSFLQEAISEIRENIFQVYQQTLARQIIFDANKRATGVRVTTSIAFSGEVDQVISARKEVILSAGAFGSPHLLMLSGIGPSGKLNDLGIPVLSDLPGVGQNLQDQPIYGPTYRVNVTTRSRLANDPEFAAQAEIDYLTNQTGPLTSGCPNFVAWEKLPQPLRANLSNSTLSDLATFPADWPEIELLPILANLFGGSNDTANYISFGIGHLAFTSVGNMTINSTDVKDKPIVTLNWFSTKTDQELAVQAFKRAREVAQASGIIVGEEFAPGPAVQSDEAILEYIGQTAAPFHHASATCAMGKEGDPSAVVDSHGLVFGVSALRIVDASIFPFLPPGLPVSTTYMVAEKAAAEIKASL